MPLRVGIVGLPNVGKSTLFNALLGKQQALAANYPFATIEPNVGVVAVPDERLEVLAKTVKTEKITPATVEFVDIAGLVKGAASGEGLGNQFLAHIREVELVAQVLRVFKDPEVVRAGSIDPVEDYNTVEAELILKDLETVIKVRESKNFKLVSEKERELVDRVYGGLNSGKPAREVLSYEEQETVRSMFLLTMKPEVLVANVGEEHLGEVAKWEKDLESKLGLLTVALAAKVESELAVLGKEEARQYLKELGIEQSGLDHLIKVVYQQLGLMSFLTAGEKEVRAWTIKKGTTAQNAAGEIHTDFVKKFIKAKVVSYDDFVNLGGWKLAADAGKVRLEGRDYVMEEGDVVEFMVGS